MNKKISYIKISDAAEILGICSQTLRLYEKKGVIHLTTYRTLGGHRRYIQSEIEELDLKIKGGVLIE